MSRPIDIFIVSKGSLEDIVKELETLLKMPGQRFSDDYETWYVLRDEHTQYVVGTQQYINDKDVHFEDYQYDIEVQAINIREADERTKHQEDAAYRVFNLLKQTKKYPLMLVDNLQIKLDEFHP
jgi:hypothetical protein